MAKNEKNFYCSPEKFNKRVSKYLGNTFGSPLINRDEETEKFAGFTYSLLPADNIKVKVSFGTNYSKKEEAYLLENKVKISLNTTYKHLHSHIIKKLEKICR